MNTADTVKILPDPHRSEPWYEELREAHIAVLRQLDEDRDSLTTRDWMIIGAKWMEAKLKKEGVK
jgi:hypothetical protein